MDRVFQDVRYALRSFARQPAFALLAIAMLGLGIGANAAIFSAVNAVLLRPLDYPRPDRLVVIVTHLLKSGRRGATVSAPDFHDWHAGTSSFAAMAYYIGGETSVSVGGAADYAAVFRVTPEFFNVFEVGAALGRVLGAGDHTSGAPLAAVISHDFWISRFGGSPDAIGRAVTFGQRAFTIVGVMPAGFLFPARSDVWYPAGVQAETGRSAHNYRVIARLKDGVGVTRAQADLSAVARRLEMAYPASNDGKGAAVVPLLDQMVGDIRPTLYLLLGAVGPVLVIACANVANLLLARATARASELAVRAALGASRSRLLAQLVTESVILALAGGMAGLMLARWLVAAFIALAPEGLPRLAEVGVDWRVLVFTLAVSALSSLIFGVLPAMQVSHVDLNVSLRHGGRGGVLGGGGARLRNGLVVAEIALAVALVTGAALMMRSFTALARVDLGFGTDRLLVVQTNVPSGDLESSRRATAFYGQVIERLRSLPGVTAVSAVRGLPSARARLGHDSNGGYWLEGGLDPRTVGTRLPQAQFTVVMPDYFRTLAIPLRSGRDFSAADTYEAPFVAIVNDTLARQAFGDADPIGRKIGCGLDSPNFMIIVGIVGDVRSGHPSEPPQPEIYMPAEQHPRTATSLALVARTAADPLPLANAFRDAIRSTNPAVPVRTTTMTAALSTAVATPRFRTLLVGTFAALALGLAMAGVYGVMAYAVGRRASEIGVRIAMGAAAGDILRLIMGHGLRLALVGIAIGSVIAFGTAQLLRGMLFAVSPADPLVFLGVATALLMTAAAATAIPALRAARMDPVTALRAE
jgi:putative ABC transport system permease protein